MTDLVLKPEECRVLGVLIEKQMTTPDYYPMTLNAITAGCNQKNNRAPVLQLDDATVIKALDRLRDQRLVGMISEAGARVPKYKHNAADVLAVDAQRLAILGELMLRGPQTAGELRQRAARMVDPGDVATTAALLQDLATQRNLIVQLPRQPGQKECRFAHLLSGPIAQELMSGGGAQEPVRAVMAEESDRLARLETETSALRTELNELRDQFNAFRKQLE